MSIDMASRDLTLSVATYIIRAWTDMGVKCNLTGVGEASNHKAVITVWHLHNKQNAI